MSVTRITKRTYERGVHRQLGAGLPHHIQTTLEMSRFIWCEPNGAVAYKVEWLTMWIITKASDMSVEIIS